MPAPDEQQPEASDSRPQMTAFEQALILIQQCHDPSRRWSLVKKDEEQS
jgi:hypothetical protein